MKRHIAGLLAIVTLAACTDQSSVAPELDARAAAGGNANGAAALVLNNSDDGEGSLRAAIARANSDASIKQIVIQGSVRVIALASTVEYTGAQPLRIIGNTATLDGTNTPAEASALLATGGGDLTILGLTVRGARNHGIEVQVPLSRTGTQSVTLQNVLIEDNLGHGVLINDQTDDSAPEDDDGEPLQPPNAGSAASLQVTVLNTQFVNNGRSVSDRDGLRVNEGGEGDLRFSSTGSVARDNAADGIELDERGSGDVHLTLLDTQILHNGDFDPSDLDDGIDIDETDAGSIVGTVRDSKAIDNFEEGFDFNENNLGDLRVDFFNVVANGNGEEGIDLEEDDETVNFTPLGGDLVTTMEDVVANGNGKNGGDGGIKIREKADGHLVVSLDRAEASFNRFVNNDDADESQISGVSIREDAVGTLTATLRNIVTRDNGGEIGDGGGHGIDLDENSDGNLTASLVNATSTGNSGAGLRADEGGAGSGNVQLQSVSLLPNAGGASAGNVTPIVIP